MSTTTVSAKEAVEAVLAQRVAEDPGFLSALALDPDGAVKPVITEVLGDDGELDLSAVNVSVHVETENRLHFVVAASTGEVEGFGTGASSTLRVNRIDMGPMPGRVSGMQTHSGVCVCATEDCEPQIQRNATIGCG